MLYFIYPWQGVTEIDIVFVTLFLISNKLLRENAILHNLLVFKQGKEL